MTVYDRWHKSRPRPGEPVCTEHGKVPTADHGDGDRWQARWRDETGRQHKQNFARKADADTQHAQVRASLDTGTYVDPRAGEITFGEYAEQWRKARTHGETTGINVEHQFRLHVYSDPENPGRSRRGGPALGHHKLRELARRPSLIQQWIAGMTLARASKDKVFGNVSSVFAAAVDDGLIQRNPMHAKSVTRPEPDRHEAIPLTLAELDGLSAALRHLPACAADCSRCQPSRYEILPYLGAATGQRQGELLGLDVGRDIDFLRRVIHVRRQVKIIRGVQVFAALKNDKPRDVPLTDTAALMLSDYIRTWPPEPVTLPWESADGKQKTFTLLLSRGRGRPLHRKSVNDRWHAALKRAGIDCDRHHMMHVLRHTAASAWLSEGISIRAVAEFLGDTEGTVQATYSHMMPDDRERARKAMERFFSQAENSGLEVSGGRDVP